MGKKEALKQFHQATIANRADQLFQEKGVEKTTMDDIARAADYSKATLYVYFKSKEDIFYWIVCKAMGLLLDTVKTAVQTEGGALQQYKALCKNVTLFAEKHPFYYRSLRQTIAVDTHSRSQNPVLEEIYQTGEEINQVILSVLQAGVQEGCFIPTANQAQTVLFLWSSLSSLVEMAGNKETYLELRTGLDKEAFLEYSFSMLLRTISI